MSAKSPPLFPFSDQLLTPSSLPKGLFFFLLKKKKIKFTVFIFLPETLELGSYTAWLGPTPFPATSNTGISNYSVLHRTAGSRHRAPQPFMIPRSHPRRGGCRLWPKVKPWENVTGAHPRDSYLWKLDCSSHNQVQWKYCTYVPWKLPFFTNSLVSFHE